MYFQDICKIRVVVAAFVSARASTLWAAVGVGQCICAYVMRQHQRGCVLRAVALAVLLAVAAQSSVAAAAATPYRVGVLGACSLGRLLWFRAGG